MRCNTVNMHIDNVSNILDIFVEDVDKFIIFDKVILKSDILFITKITFNKMDFKNKRYTVCVFSIHAKSGIFRCLLSMDVRDFFLLIATSNTNINPCVFHKDKVLKVIKVYTTLKMFLKRRNIIVSELSSRNQHQ